MYKGAAFLACFLHLSVVWCTPIHCPRLPPAKVATVVPSECVTTPMKYPSLCQFYCPDGFVVRGDEPSRVRALTCKLDGTWDAEVPKCRDIQRPTLTCPSVQIRGITTKGKPTGKIVWKVNVTDNYVRVNPIAKINVSSSHQPLQELPIGLTHVHVNATDCAGNVATCAFSVEIRDIELPTFTFCPGDIVREETNQQVRINWDRPVFSDNSGLPVGLATNIQSGDLFAVPSTTDVLYTAVDNSGNINKNCSFRITLTKKTCPSFPPPRNGALACIVSSGFSQCAVMCSTGTDFVFNPPLLYYCTSGEWKYWAFPGQSYSSTTPWPNCSATASPSWIMIHMERSLRNQFYYGGDAHDPNVQEVVKDKFHTILRSPFVPPPFCIFNPDCTLDKTTVSAGVLG